MEKKAAKESAPELPQAEQQEGPSRDALCAGAVNYILNKSGFAKEIEEAGKLFGCSVSLGLKISTLPQPSQEAPADNEQPA